MAAPPHGVFVGLTTLDLVHRLERLPGPEEKVTATRQDVAAGGPAAVAAITFAALGGSATLVTALGRHPLAVLARCDLEPGPVEVLDADPGSDAVPAVSAVRVEDSTGRRSVSSPDAGAARPVDPEPPADLSERLAGADVVLLDGHHPRLARAAAGAARAVGLAVVLDAGRWRPVFADLLPLADFVVASADFVVLPADVAVLPADVAVAPGTVVAAVLAAGAVAVARTDGPRPILWATPDGGAEIAVEPLTGGDTLGAGDVFHGAVAFAVASIGSGPALAHWPDVLGFAAAVARVRIGHPGPREWRSDPRLGELAARWS